MVWSNCVGARGALLTALVYQQYRIQGMRVPLTALSSGHATSLRACILYCMRGTKYPARYEKPGLFTTTEDAWTTLTRNKSLLGLYAWAKA